MAKRTIVKVKDLTGAEIALNMHFANVALQELWMWMGFNYQLEFCMKDRHISNGIKTGHAPKTSLAPEDATIEVEKLLQVTELLNTGLHGFGSLTEVEKGRVLFFELVDAALEPASG